jgi:uncharacterized membrane protein YkoI
MRSLAFALLALAPVTAVAKPDPHQILADRAPKLSIDDARKIALAKVPGKVVHEKLKTKKDPWTYSFKIAPPDDATKVKVVAVNADTGEVVGVKDAKDDD